MEKEKGSESKIERATVPAMNELLGKKIDVLDCGFVRPVDYLGDDSAVCQAARVSYGKGTKTLRQDRGLIRYLVRKFHTSPLEMCEIKLHIKAPIFIARQFVRHRTFSINELSGRYSELPNEMYRPKKWRVQSTSNKQGSDLVYYVEDDIGNDQEVLHDKLAQEYRIRLSAGVARELARIDLPLSQYTEWYWKVDLHNLLHFLRLRLDSHAQWEAREYAKTIAEIVKVWVPLCWEAFEDYRLNSISLSGPEQKMISDLVFKASTKDINLDLLSKAVGLSGREKTELLQKLAKLGLSLTSENTENDKEDPETEIRWIYDNELGRTKSRHKQTKYFLQHPELAQKVLLEKGQKDTDIERLSDATSLLIDLNARKAVIKRLNEVWLDSTDAFIEAMLSVIGWVPLREKDDINVFLSLLKKLSVQKDMDIRSSVAEAAEALPKKEALELLNAMRENETEKVVLDVINCVRHDLETGKAE